MKIRIAAFLMVLLSAASVARAQDVQVPIDTSGTLNVIDAALETKLRLFPEYPEFAEARMFERPDSTYYLEIAYTEHQRFLRVRLDKTTAQLRAFRTRVSTARSLRENDFDETLDQSSRTKFVVYETLLSGLVYGPLLIAASPTQNGFTIESIEFLTTGMGYLASSLLTRNAPMTDGESSLALGGAMIGLAHGSLLNQFISNDASVTIYAASATIGSAAETAIGYAIARANDFSEGRSDIVRYGGLFGTIDGMLIASSIESYPSSRLVGGCGLAAGVLGYVAGNALGLDQRYSRGKASVLLTAGTFGSIASVLIASSISASYTDGRPIAAAGVLGNLLAVGLTHSLTKNLSVSTSEGTDVILATSGGFLIGAGLATVLSHDGWNNDILPWTVTVPCVVGAAAGFTLSMLGTGRGHEDRSDNGLDLTMDPAAIASVIFHPASMSRSALNAPMVSMAYRW